MANKRMFSVDVTETDAFYSLPAKAQAIYFHLGMRADDDGFVASPKRSCGASEKILECLYNAGYIIRFKSGVIVLTDWKVNNTLKNDRYQKTVFQEEFSSLKESTSKRYICANPGTILEPDRNQDGTTLETNRNQDGTQCGTSLVPQYSIVKDRVVESSRETAAAPTDTGLAELVQSFQQEIGEFPRSALDKLQRWRKVYPDELIRRAFDEAAENGVRKWRYVDGILKGWQADGVRTLGDVEARREARKKPEQPPERKREVLT